LASVEELLDTMPVAFACTAPQTPTLMRMRSASTDEECLLQESKLTTTNKRTVLMFFIEVLVISN
jgi:hypothetical protein